MYIHTKPQCLDVYHKFAIQNESCEKRKKIFVKKLMLQPELLSQVMYILPFFCRPAEGSDHRIGEDPLVRESPLCWVSWIPGTSWLLTHLRVRTKPHSDFAYTSLWMSFIKAKRRQFQHLLRLDPQTQNSRSLRFLTPTKSREALKPIVSRNRKTSYYTHSNVYNDSCSTEAPTNSWGKQRKPRRGPTGANGRSKRCPAWNYPSLIIMTDLFLKAQGWLNWPPSVRKSFHIAPSNPRLLRFHHGILRSVAVAWYSKGWLVVSWTIVGFGVILVPSIHLCHRSMIVLPTFRKSIQVILLQEVFWGH